LARKILLADDSVTAQNMGRRILADAGYEVITVNNGSAALKKIAEHKPDLVVLDVYMPGYSGLEVCQRIKDTRETARVPVLLTVGKLEPFKPDEAKRVRADAFIVKPFEASELLSAVTKLEDKIVPEARRPKGRFGKALMEQSEGEEQFGDRETGWKDRLNIPAPGQKAEQPAAPPSSTESSEPERAGDSEPPEVEQPLPVGLPADITAQELAAIQAAAATVAQAAEESATTAKPEAGIVAAPEENPAQPTPVSFASAPQTAVDAAGLSTEPVAGDAYDKDGTVGVQEASFGANLEPEVQAAEIPSEKPSAPDADVMAAIASLAPADAQSSSRTSSSAISTGPRWIAEPVPMSDEDSTYVLEHEMEKTYAAIAAAEAGRAAVMATGAEAVGPSRQAQVIESVASPDVSEQNDAAVSIPATNEEAAYAAAASARGTMALAVDDTRVASNAVMEEGERHREAELAAAWQNWKQIRETIVGSEITAQIADVAAAELKTADQSPEPPEIPAELESEHMVAPSSSDSNAESAAIASIVDSVLAELKPKLVEEIARKMSRDRKK
jgi:CheY-like chemotaxis protein